MKRLLISLVGALSALVTQAAGSGNLPLTAADHRIVITVTQDERNQMLFEMREFLHHLFNIHNALANGDMAAVARSAAPMGEGILHRLPASVRNDSPVAFQEMSHGMHEIFRLIAKDAQVKGDIKYTVGQLAEAMTYCAGCHDTYRVQVLPRKRD